MHNQFNTISNICAFQAVHGSPTRSLASDTTIQDRRQSFLTDQNVGTVADNLEYIETEITEMKKEMQEIKDNQKIMFSTMENDLKVIKRLLMQGVLQPQRGNL